MSFSFLSTDAISVGGSVYAATAIEGEGDNALHCTTLYCIALYYIALLAIMKQYTLNAINIQPFRFQNE